MDPNELGTAAKEIIDANLYMVLGTADETGLPWATPVYFAMSDDYREFFWVSSPEATHSRNIAARPEIGIVIFNSQVPIGTGQGVYMPAVAEELTGPDLERMLAIYSQRALSHGGRAYTAEDSLVRPFRATAWGHSMLAKDGLPDHRIVVDLGG
jgi:uncharacterized protein YhbP (UPF0306 family)